MHAVDENVRDNRTVARSLWTGFMQSAERFPERPAVVVEGIELSYREMRDKACRIAATIQQHLKTAQPPLTAVLAYRSVTAFSGVLGSLLAGYGYVPLNRMFPAERTQVMFERSDCNSVIVDKDSLTQLSALLMNARKPLLILLPEIENVESLREAWPGHIFAGLRDLSPSDDWEPPSVGEDVLAYLLFTSGSTGAPKGVMVSQRNVTSFVDYTVERYKVTENDRFSQMFDMTFDLSAFDMFVCWERGACLCCPSQKTSIKPGKFIQDSNLTIWFSVPSTSSFMKQLGMLKPGQYPNLRLSLFCGEPLPVSVASAWQEAAPNSVLENLYGPTELTIACTQYRWNPASSPDESELGIVPIGYPYRDMDVLVADNNLNEVSPGSEGELLMTGPQMSLGYWKDPVRTEAAFVVPPGKKEVYYRTGDRVRRPLADGPLTHLGRIDFQIKVLGHRVELGEIESVVRKISGSDGVVAVGWPVTPSGYGGVEAFIEGAAKETDVLRRAAAQELPEYMVPRRFHFLDRLPRNANGKFDRNAMVKLIEHGL